MDRKIGLGFAFGVALGIAAPSLAQQAVQWRVEDGGNGHWYEVLDAQTMPWMAWRSLAESRGAHLATLTSPAENAWVFDRVRAEIPFDWQSAVGGFQDRTVPDYSEPAGGWRWITGEPMTWTSWATVSGNPSNSPNGPCVCEDFMTVGNWGPGQNVWNDISDGPTTSAIFEWSADCNGDGIVDYGQILDGTYDDLNSNGVPDCCDAGQSCNPCPGDITGGGVVDGIDLAAVLGAWGTSGQGKFNADVNDDGIVDAGDLSIVLAGWGNCP